MRPFLAIFAILAVIVVCNASDTNEFAWSSDTSSEESAKDTAASSSPRAAKSPRFDVLWSNKRIFLGQFRPDVALEEAGGLRKLITQNGLLSLRSPNFVIWLQNRGREALNEGAAGGRQLGSLLQRRVKWVDLEDLRKPIEAQYAASIADDLAVNEGRPSVSTIVLKLQLRLLKHVDDAPPTEHEPQLFRLSPAQSSSALDLVDKFEQFAKDAAASAIHPR